jgi:hypothetical protein
LHFDVARRIVINCFHDVWNVENSEILEAPIIIGIVYIWVQRVGAMVVGWLSVTCLDIDCTGGSVDVMIVKCEYKGSNFDAGAPFLGIKV